MSQRTNVGKRKFLVVTLAVLIAAEHSQRAAAQATPAVLSPVIAVHMGDRFAEEGRHGHAFGWYLIAAQSGNSYAQERVGSILRHGSAISDGIPSSRPHAALWLSRAARSGHLPAHAALTDMYRETLGFVE
ncbi:MAG: sel1 repeat family protein [Proteobacteria bacterium]|nr:sel1 repeat family protein [Burkholderiales bacterium]